MPQTYRTLRDVMSAVDVNRPEWAERYAVGDDIGFRIDGAVETEPVAGFSSRDEYHGLPVIVVPGRLAGLFEDNVGTAAIPKSYHAPREARP